MYLNGVPVYTIVLLGCWSSDAFLRYIRKQVESFGSGVSSKMIGTSCFLHVSRSTNLEDPRTSCNPASFTANMGMGSGGNINRNAIRLGLRLASPISSPGPTATATTRSSQARPSCPPSHWNRMNYLWSVVTSSHDAVLRRRLLSPQTQLDARDRIPTQLIASQSFLGVPGWG